VIGRRGWGSERGAAAVEFALILPILMLILFGVIEFGGVYNAQLMVTGAAREAAREMAIHGSADEAADAAQNAAVGIPPTALDVSIAPGACAEGTDVTVTVVYDRPFLTGLFGSTLELTGLATRRCQG
jgi:Flp pilus assembly protein TadG